MVSLSTTSLKAHNEWYEQFLLLSSEALEVGQFSTSTAPPELTQSPFHPEPLRLLLKSGTQAVVVQLVTRAVQIMVMVVLLVVMPLKQLL